MSDKPEDGFSLLKENELLANLDLFKLCEPEDREMVDMINFREKAVQVMCQKCVFYVNVIQSALGRTKTQREFRIAIVGGNGLVGTALIKHLTSCGALKRKSIVIISRGESLQNTLKGVKCTSSVEEAINLFSARLIILACSANQLEQVASSLRPYLKPSVIVCSLLSGTPTKKLDKIFHPSQLIRAVQYRRFEEGEYEDPTKEAALEMYHSPEQPLARFRQILVKQVTALGIKPQRADTIANQFIYGCSEELDSQSATEKSFVSHFQAISRLLLTKGRRKSGSSHQSEESLLESFRSTSMTTSSRSTTKNGSPSQC